MIDKEDILDAAYDKHPYDLGEETTTKKAAYEAMDVWGQQEVKAFIKWYTDLHTYKQIDNLYDMYNQSKKQ